MRWRVAGRPGRRVRTLVLAVVQLEDRLVPATFTVTQFSDGTSPGTLRWAINQADHTPGQNTVVVRPGVYTLTQSGPETPGGQTGALRSRALSRSRAPARAGLISSPLHWEITSFTSTSGNVKFSGADDQRRRCRAGRRHPGRLGQCDDYQQCAHGE